MSILENEEGHYWSYCDHCQCAMVVCGRCGNGTCNGGYGRLDDGSVCPACPSAYDMDDLGEVPGWAREDI